MDIINSKEGSLLVSDAYLYAKVNELKDASGSKAKCSILKKYKGDDDFRRFLYYALNPYLTYNLSEKTLAGTEGRIYPNTGIYEDIFSCCEYLSTLRGIDNATIDHVRGFLFQFPDDIKSMYTKLLAKTLRLGITSKTVNKVIKDLIPCWEVQQAYPIDKYPVKQGTEFWLTQKLNGVRATYYKGQMIARSGVPYEGLQHIVDCIHEKIISPLGMDDIVLDGELTLFLRPEGMSDNEAFRTATGIINSDSPRKMEIGFTIFDALIDSIHFEGAFSRDTYSERRNLLDSISEHLPLECPVRVLPVLYHGKDLNMIDKLLEQMISEDKEGLMLNLNVPYKRTRHNGILKVKRFYTMDLPIIRCEEGEGRLSGTLGALVVIYHGNEVKVGSGFTDSQREMLWAIRDNLDGVLCEVKYKEVSQDKSTGLYSLQFPIFVRIRNDKSEPSYG